MSDLLPPPYPADTRAKGWRFEIDYEKVEQSDTWSLAAEIPMAQPALVMMWLMAWKETPVGSYPNDENLIRAKCKLPPAVWAKVRDVCMRGWWVATDGRLYHDTIVLRVEAMLVKRAKYAKRTADNRARRTESGVSHTDVTRDTPVTHAGPACEFDTKHQAPSTRTEEEKTPKAPRKRRAAAAEQQLVSVGDLMSEGVSQQHATDWLLVRKGKSLPLTQTAWDGVKAQATEAGLSLDEAVRISAVNGWGGFKASWVGNGGGGTGARVVPMPNRPAPNRQEALEQSNRDIAARWAAKGGDHEPV